MYVAQLDRSWLETPFFFQGFEICEDREIGLLRKFCRHVYVDLERSSLQQDTIRAANKAIQQVDDVFDGSQRPLIDSRPITTPQKILRAIARLDPTGTLIDRLNRPRHYKNVVTTAKEAPRAADAYETAVTQMHSMLDDIKKGTGVTLDSVKDALTPMVDSVLRNHNAMAWLVYLRKLDEFAYNHAVASSV